MGEVALGAEEDLVFVAAAAIRVFDFRIRVLEDSSVVTADGVDLDGFS